MIATAEPNGQSRLYDPLLERTLLGGIVHYGPEIFGDGADLREADFLDPLHRRVFRALRELYDGREPGVDWEPDLIALELRRVAGDEADDLLHDCDELAATPAWVPTLVGDLRTLGFKRAIDAKLREAARLLRERNVDEADLRAALDLSDVQVDPRSKLQPVTFAALREAHPRLAEPIVEGLLRRAEVGNIISAPKIGKSWLVYSLLLSVATGRLWLGRFDCKPGAVCLIDNELAPALLAYRIREVAEALGIPAYEYEDRLHVVPLRGQLLDVFGLATVVRGLGQRFDLIALDALYRALPSGMSENDNAGMAGVFNQLARYAVQADAGWLNVHHSTKGSQSGKEVVDVGAGGGSQARAADLHCILRHHDEEGVVVLETALRSFAPAKPLALRWQFPVWTPAEELDPGALKGIKTRGEERQNKRDAEGQQTILAELANGSGTVRALNRRGCGSCDRISKLLGMLRREGLVRFEMQRINGKNCEEWRLTEDES